MTQNSCTDPLTTIYGECLDNIRNHVTEKLVLIQSELQEKAKRLESDISKIRLDRQHVNACGSLRLRGNDLDRLIAQIECYEGIETILDKAACKTDKLFDFQ